VTDDGRYDGLRKRRRPGSFIPRSVLRARYLSFAERGILAHLLDRPVNWQVRAEFLASESDRDGVERIKTALRALRKQGHYRLERRRSLDGRYAMGTSISEEQVPAWIEQYAEYGNTPIPLVQQPDRTWWVRRGDGSFTPDDFDGFDEGAASEEDDEAAPRGAPPAGTPVGENPLPEHPLPENPAPGNPTAGPPDVGEHRALRAEETENRDVVRSAGTPSQPNGPPLSATGKSQRRPPPGPNRRRAKQRLPEDQARFDAATTIVADWLERCSERGPVVGDVRVGLRDGLVVPALSACMTGPHPMSLQAAIRRVTGALGQCGEVMPSKGRFQRAMQGANGRGARAPGTTNLHVDNDLPDGSTLFEMEPR